MVPTTSNLIDYVNPLQGTDSGLTFSYGNTLPVVSTPFGMNAWVLETTSNPGSYSNWFFSPHHRTTLGVRCTHQPSPWCGDYSCFRILPQVGQPDFSPGGMVSSFSPETAVFRPNLLSLRLHRYGTVLSLAPAARGAVVQLRFPDGARRRRVLMQLVYGDATFAHLPDGRTVHATIQTVADGVHDDVRFHVVIRSSVPIEKLHRFGRSTTQGSAATDCAVGVGLELGTDTAHPDTRLNDPVTVWIATSYIDLDQALTTLEREIAPHDLDGTVDSAGCDWNQRLGRIRIATENVRDRRTFYSCLYRAQLYPNLTHEVDDGGRTVHRSFYDGTVQPGPMATNNGFWDTYRTVYPLLSLVYPETLGTILNAWVNASREGQWTPKWPAPGHRGMMIGTHLDAIFADAYTKQLPGWDPDEAYHYARKNAFEVVEADSPFGRIGLADYLELGYVPEDREEHAASRTLDFAYGDYCLSRIAQGLGHHADATALASRSLWYRNVFDAKSGFLRGRRSDGSFAPDFDSYRWGGPYVEGSAWQCGLAVYHDPLGLAALIAGCRSVSRGPIERASPAARKALEHRLDALFNAEPRFDTGSYQTEIHEMSEMAAVDFGQYAHSNQPSHHIPFLYALTNRGWKADRIVRRVLTQLYDDTPRGFCGDEDNGEMSSWYVLSSIGLYQPCPGKPEYTVTSPLFRESILEPEGGERLHIRAPGNGRNACYAGTIHMNGSQLAGRFVSHGALVRGGEMVFTMHRIPSETGD